MNKLLKKMLLVAVAGSLTVGLASCFENNEKTPEPVTPQPGTPPVETPSQEEEYTVDNTIYGVNYKTYLKFDLEAVLTSIGDLDEVKAVSASAYDAVMAAYNNGQDAILNAADNEAAYAAFNAAKAAIIEALPKADGVYSFLSLSNAERTNILGLLEAYAVRNGITGISLFENGGYVMYNPRVQVGTENYITGYGFGTLAEGKLTAPLAGETNDAWKMYYHTFDSSDPGTINALDDKGSQVSSLYGYMAGSYFTTFMNATKDGYDWVPELATAKPTAANADASGMATAWEFPVRTDIKYSTNSDIASRAAFNDRVVAAEDYITPYKLLLTQANAYERGAEAAAATTGAFKGAAEFYAATKSVENQAAIDAAWEETMGKYFYTYEKDGQTWFRYEFTEKVTSFYAMYYITSNLYQPIPQDFIDLVTVANYCGYNENKSETPVDNSLSLGAYTLETWETDKVVTFKKNPNYVYASSKYAIEGVHCAILTAAATDPNAGIKEFLAEKTDSSGIPQEYLEQYKNDPRTRSTTGDSNFKLNVNATDEATWEYLFGVNGVVCQTPETDYWQVEPALGNAHFVKALSLAIDRVTFADARGSIASVDYLSSNYMSDPENGISYASTQAHKNAVAPLLEETDGYGYSLEGARSFFKVALQELIMDGHYVPGTPEEPTLIELEIAWMYTSHEEAYHNEIKQFLETAFNHPSVSANTFKLQVNFWVGSEWSDVYYNKMMVGQYDLGFGSISGNPLNPLDFVSVLSSDPVISGEFTLNWGTDTNNAAADVLVYNGMQWSFDALWKAANATAVVSEGELVSIFNGVSFDNAVANADGSHTVTMTAYFTNGNGYGAEVSNVLLYYYEQLANEYYREIDLTEFATITDNGDGSQTIVVTVSAEQNELLKIVHGLGAYGSGYSGLDVYYEQTIGEAKDVLYGGSVEAENWLEAPVAE